MDSRRRTDLKPSAVIIDRDPEDEDEGEEETYVSTFGKRRKKPPEDKMIQRHEDKSA